MLALNGLKLFLQEILSDACPGRLLVTWGCAVELCCGEGVSAG